MKKLFLILLAAVMLLSSCSGEEEFFEEPADYDILENQNKDKPSKGNYFTYTPIIDIFSPELGEFSTFLDFYGNKFIMDSGTDKAFLFSYNLLNGKSENLTNKLGFHSENVFSDGENFYRIENEGFENYLVIQNSEGEISKRIRTSIEEAEYDEGALPPEIRWDFFKRGEKIVLIKNFESGALSTFCYSTKAGEIIEKHKNLSSSGHKTIPTNGYVTYVMEVDGLFTIFAFEPTNDKTQIFGPSVTDKILCSAFDGKHFVWSTESGIFYKPLSGKTVQISDKGEKFAFLGRNFVVYSTGEKLVLYRLDKNREGGYNYSGLDFIYADENIAVFKCGNPDFCEEFLSVQIKVGEKPKSTMDEPDMAPPMIAVDGYDYYCYHGKSEVTPSKKQIRGKITSVWDDHSTGPRKNNQGNSSEFLGSRYAFVDGVLLVESGENWYKCEKGSALSEINMN